MAFVVTAVMLTATACWGGGKSAAKKPIVATILAASARAGAFRMTVSRSVVPRFSVSVSNVVAGTTTTSEANTSTTTKPKPKPRPLLAFATGTYDFERGAGDVVRRHPVTDDGIPTAREIRYARATVYERFAPGIPRLVPGTAASRREWISYPFATLPFGSSSFIGPDPVATLTAIVRSNSVVRDRGMAHLGAQTTHHYEVDAISPAGFPPHSVMGKSGAIHAITEIYVDSSDRVVRLEFSTGPRVNPGPRILRYDFSDRVAKVRVAPPAPASVVSESDIVPPAVHLTGDWVLAAHGRRSAFAWRLYRAPADHQRMCWSFESTPAWEPFAGASGAAMLSDLAAARGIVAPPRHNGHDVVCTRTGIWANDLESIAFGQVGNQFVTVGTVTSRVVSMTADDSIETSFRLAGAAFIPIPPTDRHPVVVDRRAGAFVDVGTSPASVFYLRLSDGHTRACSGLFLDTGTFTTESPCDLFARVRAAARSEQRP